MQDLICSIQVASEASSFSALVYANSLPEPFSIHSLLHPPIHSAQIPLPLEKPWSTPSRTDVLFSLKKETEYI